MTNALTPERLDKIGKSHQEVSDDLEFGLDSMSAAVDAHNHRLELLQHIDALTQRIAELEMGLGKSQETFEHYAELHRKKGTPDGLVKAKTNQDMADNIRILLSPAPPEPFTDEDVEALSLVLLNAHAKKWGSNVVDFELKDFRDPARAALQSLHDRGELK